MYLNKKNGGGGGLMTQKCHASFHQPIWLKTIQIIIKMSPLVFLCKKKKKQILYFSLLYIILFSMVIQVGYEWSVGNKIIHKFLWNLFATGDSWLAFVTWIKVSYLNVQASRKVIAGGRLHIAAVKVGDEYFNPAKNAFWPITGLL